VAGAELTAGEAALRASLVANVGVDLHLDLTDPAVAVSEVTLRFDSDAPGAATFVDADFEVLDAECNGRPVPLGLVADGRLATGPLLPVNIVRVKGRVPHRNDGAGLHGFTDPEDGARYLYTKFQPFDAHRVFACFDQPDIKATVTVTVTAPAGWQVVANGSPLEVTAKAGQAHWQFAPTAPLPAYLVSVVAGPFASVRRRQGAVDAGFHVRPCLLGRLDSDELFELTFAGLRWYTELFGRPYAYGPRYDVAFVPEYGFGAMEHPGCVTVHERFVFRSTPTAEQQRRRGEILLHEMAHMWFGNLVSIRWWDDLWLSESLATLLAALAQAEATSVGSAAWAMFTADATAKAREADQLPSTHPVAADVADTGAVRLQFDPITYRKGASLLRQLLAELGLPAVTAGLRHYVDRHAHGAAKRSDFLAALGRASAVDLDTWSGRWLATTGVDAVTSERDGPGRLVLRRVPPPSPLSGPPPAAGRTQPLTVAFYEQGGDKLIPLGAMSVALGDDPVTVEVAPTVSVALPNVDSACYLKVMLDQQSTDGLLAGVSSLEEPVGRAVAWGALWDAVLDARLPAHQFVAAVRQHASLEPVSGLVELLLDRAEQAAWMFASDPGGTQGPRARLAAWATDALPDLLAGSDLRRAVARVLAGTCLEPATVVAANAIVSGEAAPDLEGFVDLRWQLIVGLCRAGAAGEEVVAAALAADASDEGQRQAATARAAMPLAGAKADAWRFVITGQGSLALRQAVLAGWASPGQQDLLENYCEPFFLALGPLWQDQGIEAGIAFTRAAFPRHGHSPELALTLTDRALGDDRLPSPCRRLLAEEATRLRWAAAARALDGSTPPQAPKNDQRGSSGH
jgi:aminopeptidase N